MRLTQRADLQVLRGSAFVGFRFPPDVIVLAVRWYLRFGLSYRNVEELLAGVCCIKRSQVIFTARFTDRWAGCAPTTWARSRLACSPTPIDGQAPS
jgi:hypothetical protein